MSIQTVDPRHLQQAMLLFYVWADSGEEGQDVEMGGLDLREFLDKLAANLQTGTDDTIALFQRVIAFSAYLMREDFPEDLFEPDGSPGSKLCNAAAHARIIDLPENEDGQITHRFDPEFMARALKEASN